MSNNVKNSLKDSLKALSNLTKDLLRKMPVLFWGFIWGLFWLITEFFQTTQHKHFILCLLILIVSIGIYVKNKSISETMLTFMLGILTVFTIDWEKADFVLFIVFYLVFSLLIFVIGSISLASRKETILIQAANSLSNNFNYDEVYKQLNEVFDKSTSNNQLGPIERAEVIRYLSFRKVSIDQIGEALESIEIIKTVYQIDLSKACEFFYALYMLSSNYLHDTNPSKKTINLFDKILTVALAPEQFLEVFMRTKKIIISGKLNFDIYIEKIKRFANDGLDSAEIIEQMMEIY